MFYCNNYWKRKLINVTHNFLNFRTMCNLSDIGISNEMLKEFEYINECVYSTEIKDDAFDELLGCNCNGPCNSKDECSCLKFNQVYDSNGILVDVTKK